VGDGPKARTRAARKNEALHNGSMLGELAS
jgi:hypothetical protein